MYNIQVWCHLSQPYNAMQYVLEGGNETQPTWAFTVFSYDYDLYVITHFTS